MRKILTYITGDKENFSLIHRISNTVLFLSVLFGVQATIGNMMLELPDTTIYASMFMGVVLLYLYYISRFRNKRLIAVIIGLSVALVFYIPLMWIGNAGSRGGMVYYLFLYGAFTASLLDRKKTTLFLIFFIVEAFVLYLMEFYGKLKIYDYGTPFDRISDLIISFFFVFLGIVITIQIFKEQFEKSHNEIEEKNKELNQLIAEISTQRDEIESQRDMVMSQKKILEEKTRDIEQSIDYAQRIQMSILPDDKIMKEYLSDYFVFFKPKDVVSGDFYWWTHIENHTIITVADCTGHGVPGAFMSMLGTSFLREIVQKEYITHTGVILRKLRKEIVRALKQKGKSGEQKDGMDMAIISIDHETNIVQFSGANNPLYIIKPVIASEQSERSNLSNKTVISTEHSEGEISIKNEQIATPSARNDGLVLAMTNNDYGLYEIKPDNMPIAIYERMDKFTNHKIQMQKGEQIYLFSDGFADQFGGPKSKKFKYKSFKQLIMNNCQLIMTEQKIVLEKTFNEWKGKNEQVDDVTVIGIKI